LDFGKGGPEFGRPLLDAPFQFAVGLSQRLCDEFPFGHIADVALNHFAMIDQINVADKFYSHEPSVFCLKRQVMIADIPFAQQFRKRSLRCFPVFKRTNLPKSLS